MRIRTQDPTITLPPTCGGRTLNCHAAASTALPTLADSIRWFVARTPEGRDQLAARIAARWLLDEGLKRPQTSV